MCIIIQCVKLMIGMVQIIKLNNDNREPVKTTEICNAFCCATFNMRCNASVQFSYGNQLKTDNANKDNFDTYFTNTNFHSKHLYNVLRSYFQCTTGSRRLIIITPYCIVKSNRMAKFLNIFLSQKTRRKLLGLF